MWIVSAFTHPCWLVTVTWYVPLVFTFLVLPVLKSSHMKVEPAGCVPGSKTIGIAWKVQVSKSAPKSKSGSGWIVATAGILGLSQPAAVFIFTTACPPEVERLNSEEPLCPAFISIEDVVATTVPAAGVEY